MGKITEEELSRINSVKQSSIEVASILGELTYQKIVIDNQIDEEKEKIVKIKEQEKLLFEDLKSKYGNITVNIETGEFN